MLIKIRKMMKRKSNQKGFTLVELMVVMAILALLAGLAMPKFTGVLSAAREDANNANLRMLQNAVDLYCVTEDVAPADVDSFKEVINEGYLDAEPKPPEGYNDYVVADGVVANKK